MNESIDKTKPGKSRKIARAGFAEMATKAMREAQRNAARENARSGLPLIFACLVAIAVTTLPVTAGPPVTPPQAPSKSPAQAKDEANQVTNKIAFVAAALSTFLSDSRSFTAAADVSVTGAQPGDAMTVPLGVAFSDGRMRFDFDARNLKAGADAQDLVNLLKEAEIDRLSVILRPETNATIILPAARSYADLPLPRYQPIEASAEAKIGRLEKTPVGNETVDGHPCAKFRIATPDDKSQEAFVWQAADLKDLPIRIQIKLADSTGIQVKFRNIHPGKPDVRFFAAPPDYERYDSFSSLMQGWGMKSALQHLTKP